MKHPSLLTIVVAILGLALVISLVGMLLLLLNGQPVDDTLKITIASIIAGLLGLLAPSREATREV